MLMILIVFAIVLISAVNAITHLYSKRLRIHSNRSLHQLIGHIEQRNLEKLAASKALENEMPVLHRGVLSVSGVLSRIKFHLKEHTQKQTDLLSGLQQRMENLAGKNENLKIHSGELQAFASKLHRSHTVLHGIMTGYVL